MVMLIHQTYHMMIEVAYMICICFTATQRVIQVPQGTKEVTITSTKKFSPQDITPCFLVPLKPEIKIKEKNVARYYMINGRRQLIRCIKSIYIYISGFIVISDLNVKFKPHLRLRLRGT